MKKLLYISLIAACAYASAVEAGTLSAAIKQQVNKIVVPVPSIATGDVDADGAFNATVGTNVAPAVTAQTGVVVKGRVIGEAVGETNVKDAVDLDVDRDISATTDVDVNIKENVEEDDDSDEMDEKEDGEEKTSSTILSVSAVEVRGWNPEKKAEILGASLTMGEVRSDEDLSNFAATMVINDENIDSVEVDNERIEVDYKFPAKFLGMFKTNVRAHVTVASSAVAGESRVKVKFPWLAFLYRIDASVKAPALIEAIDTQVAQGVGRLHTKAATEVTIRADTLDVVVAVLRVKHDTAMNSVSNIK